MSEPIVQEHKSNLTKVSRIENLLFSLGLLAVLLPPAAQYILSSFLLIWFLKEKGWRVAKASLAAAHNGGQRIYAMLKSLSPMFKGVVINFIMLIVIMVVWIFLDADSSPFRIFNQYIHLIGKQGVYGFIIIIVLGMAGQKGWALKHGQKLFAVLLSIHTIYLIVQRYTGIDLVHGFNAVLGDHRFSYGVYRTSGFMAHPLSLGYNLMMLSLFSYSLIFRSENTKQFGSQKLWLYILILSVLSLLMSGSRWPILVTFIVILGFESRRFWRAKKLFIVGLAAFLSLLLWEGQIIKRAGEVFRGGVSIEEKVPRIVFWKIHGEMFYDHPVLGAGFHNRKTVALDYYNKAGYTYSKRKYPAHNIYLQILADSGIVGFIGFSFWFLGTWLTSFRLSKLLRCDGCNLIIIASLLAGLMQNTLRDSEYLYCFFFWIALAFNQVNYNVKFGEKSLSV